MGLCVLLVATVATYMVVQQHDFIGFDDDLYVFDNEQVRGGLTLSGLRWAATATHASTWQPLVWVSFMLDAELYGIDPGGFHLTNVWLHALNVALLFVVLCRLTACPWRALGVAGVFALHPIHVESVAWIAERKDVLSTTFLWLAVLAYLHWTAAPRRRGRCALLLAVYTLGLMAKPMLVSLPVLLLLLDWWPLRRLVGWRQVMEKAPLLAPTIASALITVHVQHVGGSLLSMETVSLWGRIGNALVSPWRYLARLVWPRDLAVLYPHPGGWPVLAVVAAILALAGVLWLAFRLRGRMPWLLFGWGWFLVALLPVSGLVQIGWHAMADRFMYIPAVGLYVALIWTAAAVMLMPHRCLESAPPQAGLRAAMTNAHASTGLSRSRRLTLITVGGVLLLGGLAVCTRRQLSFWRSSTVLFQHAVDVTADNWMMENCLGVALEREGRLAEAEPHIRRAIRLKPDRYRAYYNLGCLAVRQGRHAVAEQAFRDALARHPDHVGSRYNLAVTLAAQGRVPLAVDELRAILVDHPRNVAALNNLACWLRDLGQEDEALACFRRLVETAPDYVTGRFNYGVTLLQLGRPAEAQVQFLETLRRDPMHAGAATGLARARANRGGDRRD